MDTIEDPPERDHVRSELSRCRSYEVYSPDGYEGTVFDVVCGEDGEPEAIRVRSGLFVPHVRRVPLPAISRVLGTRHRVLIRR